MTDKTDNSRRAFFTRGGAALGAGLAATVTGAALAAPPVPGDSSDQQNRDALATLKAFLSHMEGGRYEAAAGLFAAHATLDLSGVTARGQASIQRLLTHRYPAQDVPVLHRAYRQTAVQQGHDSLTLNEQGARSTTQLEVQLYAPLETDCTAAQMARLQGGFADSRWEQGGIEATYALENSGWKITSLIYRPV